MRVNGLQQARCEEREDEGGGVFHSGIPITKTGPRKPKPDAFGLCLPRWWELGL